MIITRCERCGLDYDQTAYEHHLRNPCDYGIYPVLACDLHRADCPYNNPVWRRENDIEWTRRGYKGRRCKPIYAIASDLVRYSLDEELRGGVFLTLYAPDPPPKPKAPRLPRRRQ